jgi:hypothetical protein
MMKNWISSVAAFAPPDDLASGGGNPISSDHDHGATGEPVSFPSESGSPEPSVTENEKPRVESVTESVRRAFAETKAKADAAEKAPKPLKTPKSSQDAGATHSDATAKTSEDGSTAKTDQGAKAPDGPPASWTAAEKQIWPTLPDALKNAVLKHDQNTRKGVAELQTKYQEVDAAIAPYHAVMRQNNVTPGQAINQLFKWHMELAGPNKIEAFRTLAKNFGVDLSTVAAGSNHGAQANADPLSSLPENLRPIITGLETRLKGFEEQNASAMQIAAKQTWDNWSKDKPHAERVRGLMAQLINGDLALIQAGQPQVSNTIRNGSIDMDSAYNAAIYANPEVRSAILQEEQGKRDAEAKAAAARARKAGASLRSGAPAGPVSGSANSSAPRAESVKESIVRALAEVRGTQH